MRNRVLTILFAMTAFLCSGQAFLAKYPKLTKKNLNKFFLDWKAYSDTIDSNNVITDSVIADIFMWNNVVFGVKVILQTNPNITLSLRQSKLNDITSMLIPLWRNFASVFRNL